LSIIYLIRHGQAGARDNYDLLSDLGKEQAVLLGQHLAARELEFSEIYCGGMNRQRLTAEIACQSIRDAGCGHPDVVTDQRWNEFSLASVYRALAPRMCEENPVFARDLEEMQEAIRVEPHTTRGAVGRCDAAMVRAWIENRYPDYEGESWQSFSSRIRGCFTDLAESADGAAIAVFTSATPITILTGAALDLADTDLLRIAGVLYNSSITVIRALAGVNRLITFNSVAHLPAQSRTFR
jgi:broad specificity phosphatase PhoE